MIPLEDKLRAAIHATAEAIPADPPPLRLGSPALTPRRRPWSRRSTWLAPLAAAVLVVAVVLGSLAVTRGGAGTATPVTPSALAGVPPYYVALITVPAKPGSVRTAAQVRSTATGAVLATIAAPKPYVAFNELSAAADDRTFALTAQGAAGDSPQRLFVLHIDPNGHGVRMSLRALPVSIAFALDGTDMALSPDGASLAVESADLPAMRLTVFNLVTGTRRIWNVEMPTGLHDDYSIRVLDGLSWTADGQHVALTGPGASAGTFTLRLLDTSDPGTNALAASKPFPPPATLTKGGRDWTSVIITPDGRTAVFNTMLTTGEEPKVQTRQQLVKVSAATGKVTAILGTPKSLAGKALGEEQLLYTNATGSVLVVSYFSGTSAGILRGDTYTPIPWTASTVTAAW
jgi:hypothetical protein